MIITKWLWQNAGPYLSPFKGNIWHILNMFDFTEGTVTFLLSLPSNTVELS